MLLNDIKYWIDVSEIEGENIILTIYWISLLSTKNGQG